MQAIILAGGFGTRLKSVVSDVPKPMANIKNLPFLAYLLTYLRQNNITDIVLSVGYLHQKIIDHFGNSYLGINIKYAIETEPLGTGGAIINSLGLLNQDEPVVILNGDTFLQIDYQKFIEVFKQNNCDLSIILREIADPSRYGSVNIDNNNLITSFAEKNNTKLLNAESGHRNCLVSRFGELDLHYFLSILKRRRIQKYGERGSAENIVKIANKDRDSRQFLINGGIYLLNPKLLTNYELPIKFSFEQDFLGKYTASIKPYGFISSDYFIDIGIPEDYSKAQIEIPKLVKNKALFLDRDGVINADYGYVGEVKNFHFIDGIFELCWQANKNGYLVIVVTNQSGIARGYYSEEQFLALTKWMEEEFLKYGAKISKTYYCPYHEEGVIEEFKKNSFDRKPNPGMILKAIEEFNIDPAQSILIGDKESDIEAANKSKISKAIHLTSDRSLKLLKDQLFPA